MSSSEVWKYFEVCKQDNTKCICTICQTFISRGRDPSSFTTSSMRKHLSGRHFIILKSTRSLSVDIKHELLDDLPSTSAAVTASASAQPNPKRYCYGINNPISHTITARICEMISLDFLPISIVENQGFRHLISEIQPRYNMPSKSYISKAVMPQICEKVKNKIQNLISNKAGLMCATVDLWSDAQSISTYLLMSASLIVWEKGNLKRVSPLLSCKKLNDDNIAQSVCDEIFSQEEQWGVKFSMIVASNLCDYTIQVGDSEINVVSCMARLLENIVQQALDTCRQDVRETMAASRIIVSYFCLSSENGKKLEVFQDKHGILPQTFIEDKSGRLSSTYHMLERMIDQKLAIDFFSQEIGTTLTDDQWKIIASLITVMRPFQVAIGELGHSKASIAYILPTVEKLFGKLKGFKEDLNNNRLYAVEEFISSLTDQMKTKFAKPHSDPSAISLYFYDTKMYNLFALASVLDPRIKDTWASDDEKPLLKEILETAALEKLEQSENEHKSGNVTASEETNSSMLFHATDSESKNESEPSKESQQLNLRTQVNQYITSPVAASTSCPIQHWLKCRYESPVLFALAIEHLSCVPVSMDAQSLLSSPDLVLSPLSNNIKSSHVEMLTFLHVNLRKLSLHY